jgi:hypothetical protein
MEGIMTHIKQNTDIGDFKVKKLTSDKPNVGLSEIKTSRSSFITKRIRIKAKRLRNSEVRVNRLIKKWRE